MFFLKNHVEKVKIENIKSNEVYAPVEGEVIPLDEVDDAVFSEKILGDGVAVEPDDLTGDGGGEQSQIFPLVHAVQQPGHVMDEAHVQHPVRLVQHHGFCRVHPDGAALHVVGDWII